MKSRGFTIVELLVVLTIVGILTTIASMYWNRLTVKTTVESQIRTVHADLMRIRLEALYGKRERRVAFSGNTFRVYSSSEVTSTPRENREFKYPFVFTDSEFVFNSYGMATGSEGSVCVNPYGNLNNRSDAAVDSLVISAGRISLGKLNDGECKSEKIIKK